MNVPLAVGLPLMVMVFDAKAAVTPAGNPVAVIVSIPVAPVVAMVILLNGILTHNVGLAEAGAAVLAGVTVIVPVAFTVPHPPVSGML